MLDYILDCSTPNFDQGHKGQTKLATAKLRSTFGVEIFSLIAHFLLNADLREVESVNLQFETDLQEQVKEGW